MDKGDKRRLEYGLVYVSVFGIVFRGLGGRFCFFDFNFIYVF